MGIIQTPGVKKKKAQSFHHDLGHHELPYRVSQPGGKRPPD